MSLSEHSLELGIKAQIWFRAPARVTTTATTFVGGLPRASVHVNMSVDLLFSATRAFNRVMGRIDSTGPRFFPGF